MAADDATPAHAGADEDDRPLVLLDRDGTINVDRGYLSDPADIELLPGAAEGLRLMIGGGMRLAIVTNQSGVGRGFFSAETAEAVNAHLTATLADEGIRIETTAACHHAPDAECGCRKPAPGLAHQVQRATGASLAEAVVIGDKPSDIGLARAIGARSVLIAPGGDAGAADHGQTATARDLVAAAGIILGWRAGRSASE
jgi:histidinol-phosphate phosphatase family protein